MVSILGLKNPSLIYTHIADSPLFIDYSKGEAYHRTDETARTARFQRITNRSALTAIPSESTRDFLKQETPDRDHQEEEETRAPVDLQPIRANSTVPHDSLTNGSVKSNGSDPTARSPFGGVAMPGMTNHLMERTESPSRMVSPAPPPASEKPIRPTSAFGRPGSVFNHAPPAATGPAAMRPSPSMMLEDDDPIARSLAQLRKDPPPAGSIRRGHSQRRPESISTHPAVQRQSYQQPPRSPGPGSSVGHSGAGQSYQSHTAGRPSMDNGLIPPMAGHTAADLARSRAEHEQRISRAYSPAPGQDYHSAAADIVGTHPSSRPATPSAQHVAPRAPSPAFMQPPAMAPSPVDEVLGQYHQAFPGERSRSRAGSVISSHSRQQSYSAPSGQTASLASARSPSPAPREGFVGIGAGRSASPQPQQYQSMQQLNLRSPSPQPGAHARGQSYSSMAPPQGAPYTNPVSPIPTSANGAPMQQTRPGSIGAHPAMGQQQPYGSNATLSQFGSVASLQQPQQYQQQQQQQQQQHQQVQQPVRQHSNQGGLQSPRDAYGPSASISSNGHGAGRGYSGYQQSPVTSPLPGQAQYGGYNPATNQPVQSPYNAVPPAQDPRYRPGSTQPGPVYQQNPYQRTASPAPASAPQTYQQPPPQQQQQPAYGAYQQVQQPSQAQQYQNQYARAISPAPQQINRSPSPVPPAPPADTPPTGQYSTTGEPVLFCEYRCDVCISRSRKLNRPFLQMVYCFS
jgi:hypothetical protein